MDGVEIAVVLSGAAVASVAYGALTVTSSASGPCTSRLCEPVTTTADYEIGWEEQTQLWSGPISPVTGAAVA